MYLGPEHRIIDGLVYTEDNILVYNLFITHIPSDVSLYSMYMQIVVGTPRFMLHVFFRPRRKILRNISKSLVRF